MDSWLWIMTRRHIFGISLRKLMELGDKDVEEWESIPSHPFDIQLELPETNMRPFVFDSKIFLAGGYIESNKFKIIHIEPDVPSSKIYQFNYVDNKLQISEAVAVDSIPQPPTLISDSFIGNIGGEVYLLAYNSIVVSREEGLWVLRSGQWQRLPAPPSLNAIGFSDWCHCFFHQDKLFLKIEYVDGAQLFLYVFDPRTVTWMKVEDNITNTFLLWNRYAFCFPSMEVSLPDVCNCSVTLTWTLQEVPRRSLVTVKIYGMLVNKEDNSVFRYQSLDECSKAIKPTSFTVCTAYVNFVDLGNGVVCALVNGHTPEHDHGRSPVLCVLVFSLSLAKEPDAEASGREQRFLSVDDVLVNRVFTMKGYMKDYMLEELQSAFIFPPKKEFSLKHAYSKGVVHSTSKGYNANG